MRALLILLGLIFALQAAPAARAQVMLDVAKITCEQFTGYKITNPQNIAMWLSGYYNGKRGNTILDAQGLNANVKKLEGYCIKNPKTLVMQAVETVLGQN
jgi:acid stress chaperone HdeB